MTEKLSLEDLKEATQYHHWFNEKNTSLGLPFLLRIKESLSLNISSIILTNYNEKPKPSTQYILRLSRETIECLEFSGETRNHIIYNLSDNSISLHGNTMGQLYKSKFKDRLKQIVEDLKQQKASIYEEVL